MKKQMGFTLIELLIVVAIIGIIAAIAIPSLLRARMAANESAAIGDTRTVISAQETYKNSNNHMYDSALTCLLDPNGCLPQLPAGSPGFLDSMIASEQAKGGYIRSLDPGPIVPPANPNYSPTSTAGYTYISTPITSNQTGVRAFGGDSAGVLCYREDSVAPTTDAATGNLIYAQCNILS